MNYPSIRIEGSILSADVLDRFDDAVGQRPADFGFDTSVKVKDEIARAWADAQDYWRIYQRRSNDYHAPSRPRFARFRTPEAGCPGWRRRRRSYPQGY
jgi:hypothetical protein